MRGLLWPCSSSGLTREPRGTKAGSEAGGLDAAVSVAYAGHMATLNLCVFIAMWGL